MKKVTLIVGEPCVGKSEVMRRVLSLAPESTTVKYPYVMYEQIELWHTRVIGNWTDKSHKFPGTDRLSMACQPRILDLIGNDADSWHYLIEGDRLGTISFVEALHDMTRVDLQVRYYYVTPDVLDRRRKAERTQEQRFIDRCKTKISNLLTICNRLGVVNHGFKLDDIYASQAQADDLIEWRTARKIEEVKQTVRSNPWAKRGWRPE